MTRRGLCAVLVLAACGGGGGGDDGDGDAPDAASTADAADPTVREAGTLFSLDVALPVDPTMQPPLAGGEVCIVDGAPLECTTSDAAGRWELEMPAGDDYLLLTIAAPGHLAVLSPWWTGATGVLDTPIYLTRDADAASFYADDCGWSYPETEGAILLEGYRKTGPDTYQYLQGATASVATTPVRPPCYFSGVFDSAPGTVTTLAAGRGITTFGNVPVGPGEVEATVTLAGATCYPFRDVLATGTPDELRVPLRAGFITVVDVVCE